MSITPEFKYKTSLECYAAIYSGNKIVDENGQVFGLLKHPPGHEWLPVSAVIYSADLQNIPQRANDYSPEENYENTTLDVDKNRLVSLAPDADTEYTLPWKQFDERDENTWPIDIGKYLTVDIRRGVKDIDIKLWTDNSAYWRGVTHYLQLADIPLPKGVE
jgi:hypothetical protein